MDDNLPRVGNGTSDDSGISIVPPSRPVPPPVQQQNQPQSLGGMTTKELEKAQIAKSEAYLEEAGKLPELEPEVERAGVQKVQGEVLIPQPVSQMGVKQAGPTAPASTQISVALPITDDQVLKGLHANVFDAFRWLAVWCIRRLKMAHLALRKVGGKIIRVQA